LMPACLLAQTSRPNIVFILTDNLGYGEVGAYGGGVTRGGRRPVSTRWPRKACVS
jgi:arylsulfatase